MKILVVAPTPFFADRGTHIRILEEALALEKRGHELTIATYHIGRDIKGEVETRIDVRRILRLLFWYKKLEAGPDWQKIVLDIMLIRKVFNLARTGRPEVIHAHLHEGVLIGFIVQKLLFWRKMKLVADFHGSLTKEMESHSYLKGGLLRKIFSFIEKTVDNMGQSACASSWENAEELRSIRQDAEVAVVLDGVNLDHYAALPAKEELRRELELPQDKTIITYAGALVPNKGISYLLEAMEAVLAQSPKAFFVLGGFPIEEAESFVYARGLEKRVRLVSPLNYFEMPKLLKASDIGIDPKDSSTRQASGKILQYMAAGLAVVCFDRSNNRHYLEDAGAYSSTMGAQGLVSQILGLIENEDVRKEKGQKAQERAALFSWDKSAARIEELYR